ncbi:MAG TPA: hypothetical protein VN613_00990, partial [Gemmatimonadaceae bacterium]|nr:hypothetical protein [Gemmatimonadaceae bacterium]
MPSSATLGIGGVIPSAGTSVMVTATLGTATCSGQRTLNTYPNDYITPLSLTSCSGAVPGGSVANVTQIQLSIALSPNTGEMQASATIPFDMDDGNPCTVDKCTNGVPDHSTPVAEGTIVSTSCSGTIYCSGTTEMTGNPLPPPQDDCHAWTCGSNGAWVAGASTCSAPTLTGYTPATTLPTDFSAEMHAVLSSNGQSPTVTLDANRLSVLRGRVRARDETDGGGFQNVVVSVVGHPEFGSVLTRTDGSYDIVVN